MCAFFSQINHLWLFAYSAILYLEGNLETKIFNDPITGLTRRVREIAIRRDGKFHESLIKVLPSSYFWGGGSVGPLSSGVAGRITFLQNWLHLPVP